MRISLCTISFRHHLIALGDLARWARANDFDGIEIWGAHARNLALEKGRDWHWLAGQGLFVPMISDYLPLHEPQMLREQTLILARIAERWGAGKIRTFAGKTSSLETTAEERRATFASLRAACEILDGHGLKLMVETHPNTLADSLASTCDLIEAADHPALGINFDVLHLWEAGDDVISARAVLRSKIGHYHLKNVSDRALLPVFAPANVYNAAGPREGIVPLFEGALDYRPFFAELADDQGCEASLEWFGPDPFAALRHDRREIRRMLGETGIDGVRHEPQPPPAPS
jgi:3-dehydroshikimate dehydratase